MIRDGVRKALLLAVCLVTPTAGFAQYSGNNLKGDTGLESGTQPPRGWNVSVLYTRYETTKYQSSAGGISTFSDVDEAVIQGIVGRFWWVSDRKLLGGAYGVLVVPALMDNAMERPAEGLDDEEKLGLGDFYFQPINLGWHWKHADLTTGLGIYLPTGLYEEGADDNTGLGMVAAELFAGSTLFLDDARTWSLAATASWESHREKKHTPVKIGDILTIEGGAGMRLLDGDARAGIAYYAQWKMTEDDEFGFIAETLDRHRVFAAGPEISIPIAWRRKTVGSLDFRGLLEFGAESTTQGTTIILSATFPPASGS